MTRRAGRAVTWLLGLLVAGILLRLGATGDLAGPPTGSLDELTAWADAREPAAIAVALVRLAAEMAVWYLLAVSALHAAATVLRAAGGHRLADAIATPGVRRLVRAGLGLGFAAASSVGGQEEATGAAGTVTMTPVVDAPVVTQTRIESPGGTATMRPQLTPESGVAQMVPSAPATWTVAPGESLWTIAEELLADAWRRPPRDTETDPFWRALIERNRHRLVDPADPDLIHPGQVFEVPPLPPAA